MILPRQGEVAPKAPEGEDTEQRFSLTSPLRLANASHLPLAGEDRLDATFVNAPPILPCKGTWREATDGCRPLGSGSPLRQRSALPPPLAGEEL